jgi:hypothetical protein
MAPPRPNAPLSLKAVQGTLNGVDLWWTLDNSQPVGSLPIYKSPANASGFNLMATYGQGVYTCADNNIAAYRGQAVRYGIQNVTGAGASNFVYDFTHISYRDPQQTSNVMVDKIEVTDKKMEPWVYGPPEFRIRIVGTNNATQTAFELGKIIYFDFKSVKNNWWKYGREQSFNKNLYAWKRNVDDENYDVITIHIEEDDNNIIKELSLEGKVGVKGSIGVNNTSPTTTPFTASVSADISATCKINFINGDHLGWRRLFYYENPQQNLTFSGEGSLILKIKE